MSRKPLILPLFMVNTHAIGKVLHDGSYLEFKVDKTLFEDMAIGFDEGITDLQYNSVTYEVCDHVILEYLKYSLVRVRLEVKPI